MNSETPEKSRFQVGLGVYVLLIPILAIILAFAYMKVMAPELDLTWDEAQQRYTLGANGVEKYDFNSKIGDDYREHPVAVEIFCNPDAQKLKEALKRLPTVRQVWISEIKDTDGKITGNVSNRKISEWFPKRFIASPRHWGRRMDYKLDELR